MKKGSRYLENSFIHSFIGDYPIGRRADAKLYPPDGTSFLRLQHFVSNLRVAFAEAKQDEKPPGKCL